MKVGAFHDLHGNHAGAEERVKQKMYQTKLTEGQTNDFRFTLKHTKSKNDRRRRRGRLVVTEERMTSECARSSKGGTDDYKSVFVLSNLA